MAPPRLIRKNATYAISRRCEGRRFLLRPDPTFNELFRWVRAVTAAEFDVEVHAAVCMSTHFHLVVTVPNGDVSELMHRLDLRLAKSIQVLRRYVRGVVWAPGQLSIVELVTPEAVCQQIAYAIVNPVKAGLCHRADEWCGVTQCVDDLGIGEIRARNPSFYFTSPSWPEIAAVDLTLPECLCGEGDDAARALIAAEVERQEAEAREYVAAKGWKVMGTKRAASISPFRCATSWEDIGKLLPHIAAGRGQTEARVRAIYELQEFRGAHAEMKARWVAGDRDVVFPAGTWWMVFHHGARVAPFS